MSAVPDIEIPPKIFQDMDGEFVEYVAEKSLTTKFPVKKRYQNPFGNMQGGMIATAIDNTIGPLSFLLGSPNVTTQLNTSFIRPITKTDEYIIVQATLIEKTQTQIHIRAEVFNQAKQLTTSAYACCMVISRKMMKMASQ